MTPPPPPRQSDDRAARPAHRPLLLLLLLLFSLQHVYSLRGDAYDNSWYFSTAGPFRARAAIGRATRGGVLHSHVVWHEASDARCCCVLTCLPAQWVVMPRWRWTAPVNQCAIARQASMEPHDAAMTRWFRLAS